MTRHEMRTSAFMLVFERIFQQESVQEMIETAQENDLFIVNAQTEQLFIGVEQNKDQIDSIIETHLKNWQIGRISKVSLAVLRLAIYEMMFDDDVAHDIAISEAVKIAQMFTTKEDVTFINGVLASITRGE